jgi:DNA-binding transcriptional ArsR family regulator
MISRKNILDLELRRKIYNYILENPSSYEREISKKMDIPKTTLRHHLITLKKLELITEKNANGYKRYFVVNKIGKRDKEILNILKQNIPRNILLYLMYYVVCSQLEISRALEKKPSTINFHLKKLKDLGLITQANFNDRKKTTNNKKLFVRKKIKREILYKLINRETNYILYNLLIICKDSVSDKDFLNCILFTNEAIERFQRRIPRVHLNGVVKSPEQEIENIVKMIYTVLPHPYHA